jgi:hypothetical protein
MLRTFEEDIVTSSKENTGLETSWNKPAEKFCKEMGRSIYVKYDGIKTVGLINSLMELSRS